MSEPIEVAQSRTIPLGLEDAFRQVIVAPLPVLFSRRHLLMPPIKEVTEQTGGAWGTTLGQSRKIHTTDGGVMHEELTELEAPSLFGYRLSVVGGAMKPLVAGVEGRWTFEPDGDGTKVTWAWKLTPKSRLTRPVVALISKHWYGYAEKALEQAQVEVVRAQAAEAGARVPAEA